MKIQRHLNYLFALFFLTAFLSSCGGLPDEVIENAEKIPDSLKQSKELINKKQQDNQNYLTTGEGKFFAPYAKAENWQQFFINALLLQQKAEKINQNTIVPMIELNEDKDLLNVSSAIHMVNRHLADARVLAAKASLRKEFLLSAKKNAPQLVKKAQNNLDKINTLLSTAQQHTQKPSIDYPAKKQDINTRYKTLDQLRDNSQKSLSLAEIELAKVASNKANYAILGDNVKNIDDTLKKLTTAVPKLKSKLDELYRSYSKTLVDMRVDYFVQLGRTSWDNYYDYPTEHTHIFTSKVDKAVATYFDSLGESAVASSRGVGNLSVRIDSRMWAALKINPHKNWSSGDDEGEYWVSNVVYKYYHKYLMSENKKQTETGWQAVNESYFWQHEKDLGLTLLSKPYAMYEEEAIKSAAPPGMEYIAKPMMVNGKPTGKNQYGEWKQDSSGLSFWQYYLAYSFLRNTIGGSSYRPYYYSDWNHYNSRDRSRGYYGSGSRYGTYGSSTYNNSRYNRSTYSRQNPGVKTATGRSKLQTASIRSSGPKNRSRGPSGGGK
jgi:hypothetical protein